jgi:hypothetical protein
MVFSKNNNTNRPRQNTNLSHNAQANNIDYIKQNIQYRQLSIIQRELNNHCSYCK